MGITVELSRSRNGSSKRKSRAAVSAAQMKCSTPPRLAGAELNLERQMDDGRPLDP
jgi:hypothetical protein